MQAACGGRRQFNFFLQGPSAAPTPAAPRTIARELWLLGPGESRIQFEGFGVQLPGCANLMFDDQYPPSSSTRQTRLPDVTRPDGRIVRQWRIESQGTHQAVCLVFKTNGSIKSMGPWYFLPFAVTVTEVPYPYQNYP